MDIKSWLRQNYVIILIFVASTSFFTFQHLAANGWDFSVYMLNAKYLFGNGYYFEWLRPPMMPVLVGLLSVFGWVAAKYLYIILVSALFCFASVKLAKAINFDKNLFYALLLSPFVLNFGLTAGTELLTLSLLMLFLVCINTYKAGIFAGALLLTRYTNLYFLPIIFVNFLERKGWKKIIVGSGLAFLIFAPWLIFNWHVTGNPFTSIANSYAQNVLFRKSVAVPFNFTHLLYAANYYLPLALAGIFFAIRKKLKRCDWSMLVIAGIVLYSYWKVPLKQVRYLFLLALPLAYFTYCLVSKAKYRRAITASLLIVNFTIATLVFAPFAGGAAITDAGEKVNGCSTYSDNWVFLNQQGYKAQPLPWPQRYSELVEEGHYILIFNEPVTNISKHPILYKTENYIILGGEKCLPPPNKIDKTYLEIVGENVGENYEPCKLLFPDKVDKLCDVI